jgi:hypothetical protein
MEYITEQCPIFKLPCAKEHCTSYELHEHLVLDEEDEYNYRHFEQKNDRAYGVPYCRALNRELPMWESKEKEPKLAYGIRP